MLKYISILLTVWSVNITAMSNLPTNYSSTQLMQVEVESSTSTHATIRLFQRETPEHDWQETGEKISALVGKNGVTENKKEGDGKTPLGSFPISAAFGIDENGDKLTNMPYTPLSPNTFCIDGKNSKFYNRIIEKSEIEDPDKHTGEEMFKYKVEYALGLVVEHNKSPIIIRDGSCIFIHAWKNPDHPTAGCIAMSKEDLTKVLGWLDPYDGPIINIVLSPQVSDNEDTCSYSVLDIALTEERNRTKLIVHEINVLSKILKDSVQNKNLQEIQKQSLELIEKNIGMMERLNAQIKHHGKDTTYSLRTNKNHEIFSCAKDMIKNDFDVLINDSYYSKHPLDSSKKTFLQGSDNNFMGTSIPNCIQTAMLTILRVSEDSNYFDSLRKAGIYNVSVSPCIHSTKLPENFDHEAVPGLTEWDYFYNDTLSPIEGELLFPTLGYAYGGSREDSRHNEKIMKTKDCSSSVANLVGSEKPFSTNHMKSAYKGKCGTDDYCLAVEKALQPIKNGLSATVPGNIFVYRTSSGGHTGVVSEIKNGTCFENLSYNRDVPAMEGLGFRINCIDEPNKEFMFFAHKSSLETCQE